MRRALLLSTVTLGIVAGGVKLYALGYLHAQRHLAEQIKNVREAQAEYDVLNLALQRKQSHVMELANAMQEEIKTLQKLELEWMRTSKPLR